MNIGTIGAGAWGLALSNVLLENGYKVSVFDKNPAKLDSISKTHTVSPFDKYIFSNNLVVSYDLKTLVNQSDIILLAVPSKFISDVFSELLSYINKKIIIINVSKGLEPNTNSTILEYLENEAKINNKKDFIQFGSILGPGFALEVIKHNLTCVCAVSKDIEIAVLIQRLFSNSYFRVYTLTDTIGAQIGTSLKNAIAIASGIVIGLGYGENTKAALITRGLAEIKRFGLFFGAKESTFLGLTGLGDLVLTCNTNESRNFSAGYEIGCLNSAKSIMEKQNNITIEGINTIKIVHEIALANKLNMPIIDSLYEVLFNNAQPKEMVKILMERSLKDEN